MDSSFEPGEVLFDGRFSIREQLGIGAMGAVYRAFDNVRRDTVALKTLHHMDAAAIYALKDEFRALSDVVHPNVVTLYELFGDGAHWFFTMELIEGTDFLGHVGSKMAAARLNDASYAQLRLAFQQLVAGIDAIHAAGKLHLDLKPSNVLVTRDGRVVIVDFGLVRELTLRHRDELVGTPAYMAPEQATAEPVSPASDWYAMGVMLFEALTQRRPFEGPSVRVIADKLLKPAPRPSAFVDVPADLDELCFSLLARDVEHRPTSTEIHGRLGMTSSASARTSLAPSSPRRQFVGRESELESLRALYRRTLDGEAVLTVLSAPSGMGKTALARHFLSTLEGSHRPLVFSGRCFERESVPYNGVDNLVDELGIHLQLMNEGSVDELLRSDPSDLLRVFPVLRSVQPIVRRCRQATPTADVQAAKRHAVESLREILGGISRKRPLVLFIDDLQWADLDSVRLLVELMTPQHLGAIFLILACRHDGREPCSSLRELRSLHSLVGASAPIESIDVGPLDRAAALSLAEATSQASREAVRSSRIVDDAGGNPFFIELLGRLASAGTAPAFSGASLDRVIVEHVEAQSDVAQRLLTVIALAGQPISESIAIAAAGVGASARAGLNELRAGRFLRTNRGGARETLETYHDRIRESVSSSLSPASRRRWHGKLAIALESSAEVPAELMARQFYAAGQLEKASTYAIAAAEHAERTLAFERAAELYALASDCAPTAARQGELRGREAAALVSSGRCVRAAQQYLLGASAVDPALAFEFRRLAARQLFTAGHLDEALHISRPLFREVGLRYPETQRQVLLRTLLGLFRLKVSGMRLRAPSGGAPTTGKLRRIDVARSTAEGLAATDPMRAASVMLECVRLSLELGEPNRVAWALSHFALLQGNNAASRSMGSVARFFDHADELASASGAPEAEAIVRLNRAKLSLSLGQWASALQHADACSQFVKHRCAQGWGLMTVANNIALFALQTMGEVGQLGTRAGDYARVASDVGDLYAEVSVLIYSSVAALASGDSSLARGRVQQALGKWKKDAFLFQSWLAVHAEALCDLYDGAPERALAAIQAAWPKMANRYLLKLSVVRPFALRLRASAALAVAWSKPPAQRAPFLVMAKHDRRALSRLPRDDARGWSALIDAGVSRLEQQPERAMRVLATAAEHFGRAGMQLEAQSALIRRAQLLGERGGSGEPTALAERLRECGVSDPWRWAAMVTAMPE